MQTGYLALHLGNCESQRNPHSPAVSRFWDWMSVLRLRENNLRKIPWSLWKKTKNKQINKLKIELLK